MWTEMETTQMRTSKDYSKISTAGESATITWVLQKLKGQAEECKSWILKKKGRRKHALMCGPGEAGGMLSKTRDSSLCDWLRGAYLAFSHPKLEAGTKIRVTVSSWLSPECFEPIATRVVIIFPDWLLLWVRVLFFICGLTLVQL